MKTTYNGESYKVPDFLIVGAAKSGTTSLHYYLKEHPKIFLPEIKESYFLSFFNDRPNFKSPDPLYDVIHDIETYSNQFPDDFIGLLGDASPSYLYDYEKTISNIRKIYGDKSARIKIIIVLRNPVDRAWSQYMHFKKNFNENLEFDEAISPETIDSRLSQDWNYFYDYIGFGRYAQQVKAYMQEFENVKVYLFEDLKSDTGQVLSDIYDFLDLTTDESFKKDLKTYNVSGVPKGNFYSLIWRIKKLRFIQRGLRKLLPPAFRNKLNNYMMERSLTRVYLEPASRAKLLELFKDEINELHKTLDREEVLKWHE